MLFFQFTLVVLMLSVFKSNQLNLKNNHIIPFSLNLPKKKFSFSIIELLLIITEKSLIKIYHLQVLEMCLECLNLIMRLIVQISPFSLCSFHHPI